MAEFRTVTDRFSVSPQISLEDVAEAAAQGFTLIINNRPDHEQPGQLTSAAVEASARAAGLGYSHIPVVGMPGAAQVEAMGEAVTAEPGKVLAFCRSGTRSICAWAMSQADSVDHDILVKLGARAGYDLAPVLG